MQPAVVCSSISTRLAISPSACIHPHEARHAMNEDAETSLYIAAQKQMMTPLKSLDSECNPHHTHEKHQNSAGEIGRSRPSLACKKKDSGSGSDESPMTAPFRFRRACSLIGDTAVQETGSRSLPYRSVRLSAPLLCEQIGVAFCVSKIIGRATARGP